MPKNRHHYVPQFYLRYFASNESAGDAHRLINLYNFSSNKIVSAASLRKQCYSRKFYGQTDELENALAALEGAAAWLMSRIRVIERLPPKHLEAYDLLLTFVVFQSLRTKRHVDLQDQMFDQINKALLEHAVDRLKAEDWHKILGEGSAPLTKDDLRDVKITLQDGAAFALSLISPDLIGLLEHLEPHLVVLGSHRHLISSDNPVVLYNQYFQTVKGIYNVGFACRGIQIFFPLSPQILLILYDPDIYTVPSRHNRTLDISDADLRLLNLLQCINADENIYFEDPSQQDAILNLAQLAQKHRIQAPVNVDTLDAIVHGKRNPNSVLLHSTTKVPNIHLDLSFLQVRRSARRIGLRQRIKNRYRTDLPEELTKGFASPSKPELFVARTNSGDPRHRGSS